MEPLECGPGGTDPNDPCPPPSDDPTTTPSGPTVTPSPVNPGNSPSATGSHTDDDDTDNVAPGAPHTTVPDGPMLPLTGFDSTATLITGALLLLAGIVAVVVARSRTRRS